MKILEEGGWKNPWSFETLCQQKQCGAKLLVEENDIGAPNYSEAYTFHCPICGNVNYVDEKLIPLRVKSSVSKGRKPPSSGWRD